MASSPKPEAAPPPAPATEKSGGSMMPVMLVVVLVPALCYGATNFFLLPKLKASILAEMSLEEAHGGAAKSTAKTASKKADGHGSSGKSSGHGGKDSAHGSGGETTHEFGMTVVNLAGAMGQRYLRANFVLAGGDEKFEAIIAENKSALRDVAINVLSSQSLAALEAPGAKNLVRNELVSQFNRALGAEVVDQLYFSEFVVQ